MKNHSQEPKGNPYSPVLCILLLLTMGIVVKTGAALRTCDLAQNSCQLAQDQ